SRRIVWSPARNSRHSLSLVINTMGEDSPHLSLSPRAARGQQLGGLVGLAPLRPSSPVAFKSNGYPAHPDRARSGSTGPAQPARYDRCHSIAAPPLKSSRPSASDQTVLRPST